MLMSLKTLIRAIMLQGQRDILERRSIKRLSRESSIYLDLFNESFKLFIKSCSSLENNFRNIQLHNIHNPSSTKYKPEWL